MRRQKLTPEDESMASVTIRQDTSITTPITSPVIDLVSRPHSPNVHWPLPTTTITTAATTTTTLPLPPQLQQSSSESLLIKRSLGSIHRDEDVVFVMIMLRRKLSASGASGTTGASDTAQDPPPPPPVSSTRQEDQSKQDAAPSSSKTAASAEYSAWTTTDSQNKPSITQIPDDLYMDADTTANVQVLSSDDENMRGRIPSSDCPCHTHLGLCSEVDIDAHSQQEETRLLAQRGYGTFKDWYYNVRKASSTGWLKAGKPYTGIFFNKDLEVIYDMVAKLAAGLYVWYSHWWGSTDTILHDVSSEARSSVRKIDEALDYRVKEFQINRTNPGMNTRFWSKKDVDRSKDFIFAIQKRLNGHEYLSEIGERCGWKGNPRRDQRLLEKKRMRGSLFNTLGVMCEKGNSADEMELVWNKTNTGGSFKMNPTDHRTVLTDQGYQPELGQIDKPYAPNKLYC
ncbi:hypothetical protein Tco_0637973 [Tanacetum coccineum]